MDSVRAICKAVDAELASAARARSFAHVPVSVAAHIGTCPRCRAGLAGLAAAVRAAADPAACALCRADLAAFLAHERADAASAAAAYQHVWRHLWGCPGCLAGYLGDGAQPGPEAGGAAPRRILLTRALLRLALPAAQIARAPTRGHGGDGFVLFEDGASDEEAHLTVMVRDSGDGTWQMVVITRPPIIGKLRLSAGTTRMVAPFSSDGRATLSAIPFALLADHVAPDLELIILPADHAR